MDYSTFLTDDQKREVLSGRIQQFAAEAYQHSLNLKVAQANNDANAEAQAESAIATLDNALKVHFEELQSLSVAPVSSTPPIDPTASADPSSAIPNIQPAP
jgi:hypothetical protein